MGWHGSGHPGRPWAPSLPWKTLGRTLGRPLETLGDHGETLERNKITLFGVSRWCHLQYIKIYIKIMKLENRKKSKFGKIPKLNQFWTTISGKWRRAQIKKRLFSENIFRKKDLFWKGRGTPLERCAFNNGAEWWYSYEKCFIKIKIIF